VTGCLEINARELVEQRRNNFNFHLQIHATFTETSTGIKLKETARSPNVVRRSKTMTFVDVPQNFKSGLPIAFKVLYYGIRRLYF
jgi:hypothetical protein